jgi:hypothetical protein
VAVRKAEVAYIGDAGSLIRASEQAAAATEAATAKIAASHSKVNSSFLSMQGAGKKAAGEIESSAGRIGSAFTGIASSGNVAIAGIVGIAVAVEAVKKSASTLDELTKATLKLHNTTGLSTESASKYAAIAKVTTGSADSYTQALGTLSKNVQKVMDAHDGLSKAAKTQEALFKNLHSPGQHARRRPRGHEQDSPPGARQVRENAGVSHEGRDRDATVRQGLEDACPDVA